MEDYQLKNRPIKELVVALRSMEYDVTEQDLTNPTPYRTQVLFENFIYLFTPEKYEILEKARAHLIDSAITLTGSSDVCSEDPIMIYSFLKSFLKRIRFTNFELTDVITPTSRRLIPIINAVVNFAMFSQTRWGTCDYWNKFLEEADQQIEETKRYEEIVKKDFERKTAQKLKEEEEIKEIRKENARILEEVNTMKEKLDQLQANKVMFKKEKESLKDVLQGDHIQVLNVTEQFKKCKKIIDLDLEDILAEIENLRIQIQDNLQKLDEALKITDSLKLELAHKEEITDTVDKCTKIMFHIKSMNSEITRQGKLKSSMEERSNAIQEQLADITEAKYQLKMENADYDIELQQISEQAAKLSETRELFYVMHKQKSREIKMLLEDSDKKELVMQEEIKQIDQKHKDLVYQYRVMMHQISNKITLIQSLIEQKLGEIQNMEYPEAELVEQMSKNFVS